MESDRIRIAKGLRNKLIEKGFLHLSRHVSHQKPPNYLAQIQCQHYLSLVT